MRRVLSEGRIRTCRLPIGRGHPITLVEPSDEELRASAPAEANQAATAELAEDLRGLREQAGAMSSSIEDLRQTVSELRS